MGEFNALEKIVFKSQCAIRGGCSPIGMKKKFPTFLDETAILCDEIAVSAGQRGCQVLLAPDDLIGYCEMTIADLTTL